MAGVLSNIYCILVCLIIAASSLVAEPFQSYNQDSAGRPEQLVFNRFPSSPSRNFPINRHLEPLKIPGMSDIAAVNVHVNSRGQVFLPEIPSFKGELSGRTVGRARDGSYVVFTIDSELQAFVERTVKDIKASHAAIVVMNPHTGRILALSDKSSTLKSTLLHSGFPAASLFKVVTSAAALEQTNLKPKSEIRFRGGNYTLNKYNYNPSTKYDNRSMTLEEALGKSCNAVFARVALQHLSRQSIGSYAEQFGFNQDLAFDSPSRESSASIPSSDYELSRTAAGFGKVYISPIHAASFMSVVANGGYLKRPHLVDRVISKQGNLVYKAHPDTIQQVVKPTTASTLLKMMETTTTKGTSKYAFFSRNKPYMPGVRVSGKTGTLTGSNPKGLNKWFVGSAPIDNPEVTVAVLVVNPHNSSARSSYLGRRVLQEYFKG